jgi:hypothetical protein
MRHALRVHYALTLCKTVTFSQKLTQTCLRTPQTGRPGSPRPERDGGDSRPYCMCAGPVARPAGRLSIDSQCTGARQNSFCTSRERCGCHAGARAGTGTKRLAGAASRRACSRRCLVRVRKHTNTPARLMPAQSQSGWPWTCTYSSRPPPRWMPAPARSGAVRECMAWTGSSAQMCMNVGCGHATV